MPFLLLRTFGKFVGECLRVWRLKPLGSCRRSNIVGGGVLGLQEDLIHGKVVLLWFLRVIGA